MTTPLRHAMRTCPHGGRRAFSFVEVAVVISIILILTTIALSTYASNTRYSGLNSAALQVSRAMIFARQYAITRDTSTHFQVDLDRQAFWVDEIDPTTAIIRPKVADAVQPEPSVRIVEVRKNGVSSQAGRVSFLFDPLGTNPLIEVVLYRVGEDPASDSSYITIRLHPSSEEVRVLQKERP